MNCARPMNAARNMHIREGRQPIHTAISLWRNGTRNNNATITRQQLQLQFQSTLTRPSMPMNNTNKGPNNENALMRVWRSYNKALTARPLLVKGTVACVIFFSSDVVTQRYFTFTAESSKKKTTASSHNAATTATATAIDYKRAASGAAFGWVGTVWLHYWWNFLETVIQARLPVGRHRLANTLTKVVIDQSLAAPLYIYTYFFLTNFLQGISSSESGSDMKNELAHENDHILAMDLSTHNTDEEENENATSTRIPLSVYEAHRIAYEKLWPTMFVHWSVWPPVHVLNFYFNPIQHRILVQNVSLVGWSGYLSHRNNTPTPSTESTTVTLSATLEKRPTAKATS